MVDAKKPPRDVVDVLVALADALDAISGRLDNMDQRAKEFEKSLMRIEVRQSHKSTGTC